MIWFAYGGLVGAMLAGATLIATTRETLAEGRWPASALVLLAFAVSLGAMAFGLITA